MRGERRTEEEQLRKRMELAEEMLKGKEELRSRPPEEVSEAEQEEAELDVGIGRREMVRNWEEGEMEEMG